MEVEQASSTAVVFTNTGGMGEKRKRSHSRLAERIANKKGEDYGTTTWWISPPVP